MGGWRALVVGGGIAGLSLERALRGGPCAVELVERDPGADRLGAGLAVQPNAMRALDALGVADAVQRAGAVVHRFQYRDRSGALLCDVDLHDVWGSVGPFIGVTRAALHSALRPGREPSGGTRRSVTCLRQAHGRVSVTFDDATTADYDLVVGADGIDSGVRRLAVGGAAPAYSGQMAWRSLAHLDPEPVPAVRFWLGEDRFFGLCPAGDRLTYGFGNVTCPRFHEPVEGRRRRLAERFADFAPPVREYLAAVAADDDIHCGPIQQQAHVAWGTGRVVLIGDAAHAMSPMMGQGGCMAVEDAVVLAEELRRAGDVPTALAAFAERRTPRVHWVREQSRVLGELVRLPAAVRDRALRERGSTAFADRYRPLAAAP